MNDSTKQPPLTLEALVADMAAQRIGYQSAALAIREHHKALLALEQEWSAPPRADESAERTQTFGHCAAELRSLLTERDLGGAA